MSPRKCWRSTTSACTCFIVSPRRDDALIATGEQMHLHVDTRRQGGADGRGAARQARDSAPRRTPSSAAAEAGKPVGSRAKG
jgi:hypothetical protein